MNLCANLVIKIKKVVNFAKYVKSLEIIEKRQVENGLIAKNAICGCIRSAMMLLLIVKNLKKLVCQPKNIFAHFVVLK